MASKSESARSSRNIALTSVEQWENGNVTRAQDYLAVEEPLEIRIGDTPLSVTMRTPGNDLELAAGFLFSEGVIASRGTLKKLEPLASASAGNTVSAHIAQDASSITSVPQRNFFAASSCGICGKATIDSLRARGLKAPNPDLRISADVLCSLPEKLLESQAVFGRTGGLHAAGAFTTSGELLVLREDIGRHNAVDKIIGWALLNDRLPLSECVLMVSGRGGFEIVQKSLVAGIPVLASVSAPSSLAVQMARELGMTLVGFLRGKRFVVYSGEQRFAIKNDQYHRR
ncbi:MAG TPA: formate dehydrogenase accessory sulfurtransferase FdhD [Terriglobales bacterium]|nr:formate dehydrogenase accessory sulfurtransferase FdhD [Terriglobales bacterium]